MNNSIIEQRSISTCGDEDDRSNYYCSGMSLDPSSSGSSNSKPSTYFKEERVESIDDFSFSDDLCGSITSHSDKGVEIEFLLDLENEDRSSKSLSDISFGVGFFHVGPTSSSSSSSNMPCGSEAEDSGDEQISISDAGSPSPMSWGSAEDADDELSEEISTSDGSSHKPSDLSEPGIESRSSSFQSSNSQKSLSYYHSLLRRKRNASKSLSDATLNFSAKSSTKNSRFEINTSEASSSSSSFFNPGFEKANEQEIIQIDDSSENDCKKEIIEINDSSDDPSKDQAIIEINDSSENASKEQVIIIEGEIVSGTSYGNEEEEEEEEELGSCQPAVVNLKHDFDAERSLVRRNKSHGNSMLKRGEPDEILDLYLQYGDDQESFREFFEANIGNENTDDIAEVIDLLVKRSRYGIKDIGTEMQQLRERGEKMIDSKLAELDKIHYTTEQMNAFHAWWKVDGEPEGIDFDHFVRTQVTPRTKNEKKRKDMENRLVDCLEYAKTVMITSPRTALSKVKEASVLGNVANRSRSREPIDDKFVKNLFGYIYAYRQEMISKKKTYGAKAMKASERFIGLMSKASNCIAHHPDLDPSDMQDPTTSEKKKSFVANLRQHVNIQKAESMTVNTVMWISTLPRKAEFNSWWFGTKDAMFLQSKDFFEWSRRKDDDKY